MGIILEELDKNDGHFSFWHFQLLTLSKHSDSIISSHMPIFSFSSWLCQKREIMPQNIGDLLLGGGGAFFKNRVSPKTYWSLQWKSYSIYWLAHYSTVDEKILPSTGIIFVGVDHELRHENRKFEPDFFRRVVGRPKTENVGFSTSRKQLVLCGFLVFEWDVRI